MIYLAVHRYAVVAPSPCETVEVTDSVTIKGDDIDHLPDEVRKAAADMARPFGLEGTFRDVALAAASRAFEPIDHAVAGAFDYVFAAYRAAWWGSRGALIGKRVGDNILWPDGREQAIEPPSKSG